jgi:hypothetical protein
MASEGNRQGTNHGGPRGDADKRAKLLKEGGILISPYRIVVIRNGQFVNAPPGRSKAL